MDEGQGGGVVVIGLVLHAGDGGGRGRRDVGVVREGRRVRRGNMREDQRRIREGGEAVLHSGGFCADSEERSGDDASDAL